MLPPANFRNFYFLFFGCNNRVFNAHPIICLIFHQWARLCALVAPVFPHKDAIYSRRRTPHDHFVQLPAFKTSGRGTITKQFYLIAADFAISEVKLLQLKQPFIILRKMITVISLIIFSTDYKLLWLSCLAYTQTSIRIYSSSTNGNQ